MVEPSDEGDEEVAFEDAIVEYVVMHTGLGAGRQDGMMTSSPYASPLSDIVSWPLPRPRAVQQVRFDAGSQTWTLWWADRNGRWDRYWDVDATADIDELLREIDEDPTGSSWVDHRARLSYPHATVLP